jgi:uncharacterized protein (TIRG00374 family)
LKRKYLGAGIALAATIAAIVFVIYRWRTSGFAWSEFAAALRLVDWSWLVLSQALVLATYLGRALRWEVMLRPLRKDSSLWGIFTSTVIGFTAVLLFGRAGEAVRPYLIAKKEDVSFSSQIAAWIIERMLDLLMILLIFGIALTQVSHSAIRSGPKIRVILEAGGYTAGFTGAASLALLIALRQLRAARLLAWLSFLPERILRRIRTVLASFEEGMQSMRGARSMLLLVAYSIAEWMVIAAAFACVFRAFPATRNLGITDVVILLGFVAFGSALQIPGVGGGMQIATVLVLTEFFGINFATASGIALVLWIISFVAIVPIGLILAFHEGLKWRNLKHLGSTVSSDESPSEGESV